MNMIGFISMFLMKIFGVVTSILTILKSVKNSIAKTRQTLFSS